MSTRIERMEAVVEAARELQEANHRANRTRVGWTEAEKVALAKVRAALTAYDTDEAIARGEISPDEAALVDETDE